MANEKEVDLKVSGLDIEGVGKITFKPDSVVYSTGGGVVKTKTVTDGENEFIHPTLEYDDSNAKLKFEKDTSPSSLDLVKHFKRRRNILVGTKIIMTFRNSKVQRVFENSFLVGRTEENIQGTTTFELEANPIRD